MKEVSNLNVISVKLDLHKKNNLRTHTQSVHTGEKQFKCDICSAVFKSSQNLNIQATSVHEGKKMFKCEICYIGFVLKSGLKSHVSWIHDERKKLVPEKGFTE